MNNISIMSTSKQSKELAQKRNKYIDLKTQGGRLFPTFILANFKKYKLPDIIRKAGEDPCAPSSKDKDGNITSALKAYQVFLGQYLDFRSPYRDMLIYHGLGSGKTASAINIYNVLYNYTPGWNVFILIKASLKGSWLNELKKWLGRDEYEFRFKNIEFVHYDSPFAHRDFADKLKGVDSSKKSLYIIDEVHNFIRNVYSNVSTQKGKRAQQIYDYIIQDKKENPDTRVILLSGTPAINQPFEFALLFNLLRPGVFPRSENEFNHQFVGAGGQHFINKNNKNMFQRRILGLVSYYVGSTPDVYASTRLDMVNCKMSSYQEDIYNHFEEEEEKIAAKARLRGGISQTYKSYTRQASNFVFPPISQRINAESRPRPGKFRLSEREAMKLEEGRDTLKADKDKERFMNVTKYREAMDTYIKSFDQYLFKHDSEDKVAKHTIMDDVDTFIKKYDSNFDEFNEKEKTKSKLYEVMHMCSDKMTNIAFNVMASKGPTVVYSNYVYMEGLQIFKIYLKYFNFYNYMETKEIRKDKTGYVEFHGGIKDIAERYSGMDAYNNPNNLFGEYIKIMLISSAGAEGLSLRNVRQVHIMEPHWNEVRITQMIGRGIRQCSHSDLPMADRHVDIYRYKSVRVKSSKQTTDEYIEASAKNKDGLIQSFLDSMKEAAVDCVLNKKHNMLINEYKCFQFEEPSLFDPYVAPAYKEDIYDDMRIDNGSNSIRAITQKIKVMKIKAVKIMSPPGEPNPEYSKPESYWFYPKTGVVYDFDLHYPYGRTAVDDEGLPVKLDKDTYVIDYVIPLPMIQD
jgi:hypothetical protein